MKQEMRGETGRRGEAEAERFLNRMGLRTLDKNWRAGHREIDLIMEWSDGIHFIEVKTLRAPNIREPYESINRKKQLLLLSAARVYLASRRINREALFDIVSVVIEGEDAKVEYFPDAFSPNW
ncbi:MAG: YraN family protein [Bacteroidetes bacterium HGW-Bacteroidetes-14]|jgi:putative endonuclease|nr:MAG: YraN family protein [Bacteroidetes bacterium HGW-Bacteroidetes-14]